MIADPEIFRLFEEEEIDQALEEIITPLADREEACGRRG